VLDASVPSIISLLGGPEVDEGEELNITIVLSFVSAQVVTVVLGGPPVGGKTIADGSINQIDVSHDVISLVITLVTDPTADEGTETEADGGENGIGLAVPGGQEEQGNSVEDLNKFNNVVGLEKVGLLKLEQELQVVSLGDFVFFSDVGGGHVFEHFLGSFGVKSVEIISDIAIMEVFEDQTSTGMSLAKLGQVIKPVINDNLDLLVGSHRILISLILKI